MMTMVEDQASSLRRIMDAKRDTSASMRRLRCISVASGKGGVGKTVVSIGLAINLAKKGFRVLMLDADLGLANVDIQIGVDPKMTIQDVIFGGKRLDEVVVSVREGLDLLASSTGAAEMADMGSARRSLFVDELLAFAAGYDFLIIDVAAGIGQSITAFLQSSPEVLIVVANEPTSIMDAYSLIKVVGKSPVPPRMHIVINMVKRIEDGEHLYGKLDGITRRFLGQSYPCVGVLPYDPVVGDAIRARRSVAEYAPGSAASICLKEVAEGVIERGRGGQPGDVAELIRKLAGAAYKDSAQL